MEFQGAARPLSHAALGRALDILDTTAPELWAVLTVETLGCGFLPDRRPLVLFERHVFSRLTGGRFDASHPDLSNTNAGGYGKSGSHQHDRLARAIAIDRQAALKSASWGIGQVMGFNAITAGYPDVESMVRLMTDSESEQLGAMATWIRAQDLHIHLRRHNWSDFARGYNGAGYAARNYQSRLAGAYQKWAAGPLPDLLVRTAQVLLRYLDYDPGPIDGLFGRFTRSAMQAFQVGTGLPITEDIPEELEAQLIAALESRGASTTSRV